MENLLAERKGLLQLKHQNNSRVPESLESVLQFASVEIKGNVRRAFMAQTVDAYGHGGQRWAEKKLCWNRGTIRKGQQEMRCGFLTVDEFSKRGRDKSEDHLPNLIPDIKAIADPMSQADPTFRTTRLYLPLTAKAVRKILIEKNGYTDEQLPCERTIRTKLNQLGYWPQRVAKSKPQKKIPETNAIFEWIHELNREADETDGVLRLSLDAKASIKIGPFSRKGRNRRHETAIDHDFEPDAILSLFGFLLPAHDDVHLYFSKNKVTADFIVDALEYLWPTLQKRLLAKSLLQKVC